MKTGWLFSVLLAASICSASMAEETGEDVARFLEAAEKARPAALATMNSRLQEAELRLFSAKRGKIQPGKSSVRNDGAKYAYTFPTAAEKAASVARLAEVVAKLKTNVSLLNSGRGYPIANSSLPLKVGGFLSAPLIVDVVQVIDRQNSLVTFGDPNHIWWLSGVDTSKFTDGQEARIGAESQILFAAGTKMYRTAIGGQKTVVHVRFFDVESVRNRLNDGEELVPDTIVPSR